MKAIIYNLIFLSFPFVGFGQTVVIDKNLTTATIDSTDWNYPWHVIKHTDGHFENTFGTPITSLDTIHVIKNSQVYVHSKDVNYQIPYASATIHGDTLSICLTDESASNFEQLTIQMQEGEFELNYNKAYIQILKERNVEILEQKVVLSQNNLQIGQEIRGEVFIKLAETIKWSDQNTETIEKEIKGSFIAISSSNNE